MRRPLSGVSPELAKRLAVLSTSEEVWKSKQAFFKSHGYMLRPRYRPGWTPSWEADRFVDPLLAEDSVPLPWRQRQIDATRVADGRQVYIKAIATDSEELHICLMFSDDEHEGDPRNHVVPVLEVLRDEQDPNDSYLVMPLLRDIDDPPFELIEDVVVFVDQVLEGLAFMHASGVAHRDCAYTNLQMDASSLYPKGFHPVLRYLRPDAHHRANPRSRFGAPKPVKYYFIDFGISAHIPSGAPKEVVGTDGIDQDVPELSDTVPYDPFKVDIFILGSLFNLQFYLKFSNTDFLLPLIRSMLELNPAIRPDAATVLQQWLEIRCHISSRNQLARLRTRSEGNLKGVVSDVMAFLKLGVLLSQKSLRSIARFTMFSKHV